MSSVVDFVVVGAGPSGLTTAFRLLEGGKSVLLFDRNARPGGLAMSFDYEGHVFDVGPKRFHTEDQIVLDFIHRILDMSVIGRSTLVNFSGRYFNWPLQTKDIIRFPPALAVRALFDMIGRKSADPHDVGFPTYIQARYGNALYETFFRPYTEKFLRWDIDDIHRDWASTGINRAVVDSRVKSESTGALLAQMMLPKQVKTEFLYPHEGGFGAFYDALFAKCESFPGFSSHFGTTVTEIFQPPGSDDDRSLTMQLAGHGEVTAKEGLIWTGNLNNLLSLIDPQHEDVQKTEAGHGASLSYLNTIFFNFIARADAVSTRRAQWIYVSAGDLLVSRLTCMNEFSPRNSPDGYYNFIAEVTDSQVDPLYFDSPELLTSQVLDELERIGFLKNRRSVEGVRINKVRDTYPIYHRRYEKAYTGAHRKVKDFSRSIELVGRSGAYWYNNSDHSIRMALATADRLLGTHNDFDHRTYFGSGNGLR